MTRWQKFALSWWAIHIVLLLVTPAIRIQWPVAATVTLAYALSAILVLMVVLVLRTEPRTRETRL